MDKIYQGFSPLKSERTEDGFSVSVYGRTYTFKNSFLPISIISAGEELLTEPMSINLGFCTHEASFKNFSYVYLFEDDESAKVLASAECGNVVINATITIELDGFIKLEMRISNFWSFSKLSAADLNSLSLSVSLSKKHSTLFHFWPNDKTSIIPSATAMNSGATKSLDLPFKPYVWCGDEYRGLGFWCESDKGIELDDAEKFITVEDKEDRTEINIRLLDNMPKSWQLAVSDKWVDTLRPLLFTFGFQATPVKAVTMSPEDIYKRFHLYDVVKHNIYESDIIERVAAAGAKWLILHEDWTVIQNYGLAYDEEKFREFVKKAHSFGLKVMTYFGYEYSSLAPDFCTKADEYLIKNTSGNFTGGWQRQIPQRAYMACYNGGYGSVMLERVKYVMDNYGVDGIYTDGTYVPWECANTAHGCGYTDTDGVLHTTFPILAVREHVKKLYREVHMRGGIIDTHQSSCCLMPTLAFADSYFDGENIQGSIDSDINFLNLAAFRCEYMGNNMGLTNNFITYIDFDKVAAISLIHNVLPRVNRLELLPKIKKIWDIYDENRLNESEFCPYWKDNKIKTESDIIASTFLSECGKVVFFTSYNKEKTETSICFGEEYTAVYDLISGETYPINKGYAKVKARFFKHNIIKAI